MFAGRESRLKKEMTCMTELQDGLAKERAEIAKRVAKFRATQEKFRRERDEYFAMTLGNARREKVIGAVKRPPFW
jgi:hypothetical protein